MEQPFREMLGVAAIPLVQPYHIHAARERLRGESAHVVRIARSVQAVQRDERRTLTSVRLPMAVGGDTRPGGDVEVAPDRRRQARKISRVAPAVERHAVTAQERRPRFEHPSMIAVAEGLGPGGWGLEGIGGR